MKDFDYLQRAYHLALRGQGRTSPNPAVGAVLVKAGEIVAEDWHRRCGGMHAESAAIKRAGAKARGAALFVTLEPCAHWGRTPPCVDAVIASGIKRVVIGMKDPHRLTNGKSVRKLRRAGIQAQIFPARGSKEKQLVRDIHALNEPFVKRVTCQMPFVVAKLAQTLDGKIATSLGHSQWITAEKTRQFSRGLRSRFDAIMIGVGTVLADNPHLHVANRPNPIRKIILDSSLRSPLTARVFKEKPERCILVVSRRANAARIASFLRKGIEVWTAPLKGGHVSLPWVLKRCAREGMNSVLIEGGANVIGTALKEKVVDKIHIYIAPKIFGDSAALSAVVGRRVSRLDQALGLTDVHLRPIGGDIFIEGRVQYESPFKNNKRSLR